MSGATSELGLTPAGSGLAGLSGTPLPKLSLSVLRVSYLVNSRLADTPLQSTPFIADTVETSS